MIRPFGLRDALLVRDLQTRGAAFDLRRSLLQTASPISAALLGYLTRNRLGSLTFVADGSNGSGGKGFAQLATRGNKEAWDLTWLAPSLNEDTAAVDMWQQLLSYAIMAGAESRIQRIYARSPEDGEAEGILRRSGFTLVTREEVFVLSSQAPPSAQPRGFRQADSKDQWALSRLYRQVVPPLVYQADGLADLHKGSTYLALSGKHRDFVWTDKGEALAYLRLTYGINGYWIDCVVQPDYRADLLPYIKYLLTLTECSPSKPVYFAVPDHSVGLGWLLRTLGFESYSRQVVMVAHTVSRVSLCRPVLVTGWESTVEMRTRF